LIPSLNQSMIIPCRSKWKTILSVFVVFLCTILANGKSIDIYQHNEKASDENNSELYFHGAERETTSDDALNKLSDADLPQNGELFEGDMVMDNTLRRAVLGEESKKSAVYDAEVTGTRHWPNGRIPYTIKDDLHEIIKKEIPTAIKIFNDLTCVRFVPKEESDYDFVEFRDGHGCSSSVGRSGGKQNIKLAEGCKRFGTVQHEMMHAMGIIHEQSRPDRDDYIKVNFDAIKPRLLRNFQKYDFQRADNLGTPYNYYSIMHYSNHAFSDNGKETLVAKFDEKLIFGQRKIASKLDIDEINKLYQRCTPKKTHAEYLHENMTAKKVIENKRDQLRDERKIKELLDLYLK